MSTDSPAVKDGVSALYARGEDATLPPLLRPYVEKVVRFAYKVTDDDIQALLRDGYAEDVVFEITVSAALGAGLGRLETGLAALKGGE
jgi:hypothetical protein